MSVPVELLLVGDGAQLRDPARLRRLRRRTALTHRVVAVAGGLVSATCAAAASRLGFGAAFDETPVAPALWVAAVVSAAMAAIMAVFSRAFWVEAGLNPLDEYFKDPHAYDFLPAEVTSAAWRPAKGGGDFLLKVRFEGGRCFGAVEARSWSRHFTTKAARRSLEPGDDCYDDDGARRVLPVKAWVLRRRGGLDAELVGIASP
ncbi:MAG: hypothetical protein SF051_01845 [Elusimicrobiota bacterium]|nr:hypothetical protein [Elusimicrobiota bacterium]